MKQDGEMILSLPDELEQFVHDKVQSGASASGSEYIRDLVRERYLQELDRAAKLKKLDEALARGLADVEAGRVMPMDEAFRRLRLELGLPQQSASG